VKLEKVTITGSRGSWFAHAGSKRLPILWKHQIEAKEGTFILTTDWVENGREDTASKRKQIVEFFDQDVDEEMEFICAEAKDPNIRPHSIGKYVCVYLAKVLSTSPEIELLIIKKTAIPR
jgi:hypothetical protein